MTVSQIGNDVTESLKMVQTRPLFVYFRSFQNSKTNIAQI